MISMMTCCVRPPSHVVCCRLQKNRVSMREERQRMREEAQVLRRAQLASRVREEPAPYGDSSWVQALESIETVQCSTPTTAEDVCPICLDPMINTASRMPCGHTYHNGCITSWVQRGHGSCPMCRSTPGAPAAAHFAQAMSSQAAVGQVTMPQLVVTRETRGVARWQVGS